MSASEWFASLQEDEQTEVLEAAVFALTGESGREFLDLSDEYCANLVAKLRGFMNEEATPSGEKEGK